MPINQLNLPAIYGAAQQYKTQQAQNQMAGMEMESKQRFNALAPDIAGGDYEAYQSGLSEDPQGAQDLWGAYNKEDNARRTQVARLAQYVLSQPEQERPQAWQQVLAEASKMPGMDVSQMPQEYDERMVQMILARSTDPQAIKGQSPIGKSAVDVESGLVTPEQHAAVVAKANAPKGPLVNITNPGQTIESKLLDQDLKVIAGTEEAIKASSDFMPRLEVIVQGLESGNVETGRWQEAMLPLKQWAQSAGWYNDPNLGQQEAVLSAISYMIPRMRVPGSGQTSDVEISLFSKATAQFSNTPEGNILIARGMMQLHKRNKKLLTAQRSWIRKHKTLDGFDADKEIGPMFQHIKTQDKLDELESGTVFIDDNDGRFKVKL